MNRSRLTVFLILITVWSLIASCQFPGFGRSENACGPSTLKIGDVVYEIKTVKPRADGSFQIPADTSNVAYWVEGTNANHVFGLSNTGNHSSLVSSVKPGDEITVNWDNCNSTSYVFSSIQEGVPDNASLLDQSIAQVTIFVQPDTDASGFVILGELAGETINSINTADTSERQAEISLMKSVASADGQTIQIDISILNYGSSAFSLSASDVSLTPENATALSLTTSQPALPFEIQPGETVNFQFTFPRPSSESATLKILDVEYVVDDY